MEKVLSNNPILPSFYVRSAKDNMPYYVTLRPSKKLHDLVLNDYARVQNEEDIQRLAIDYPFPEHSRFPGPLFRSLIVDIEATKTSALVIYGESAACSYQM